MLTIYDVVFENVNFRHAFNSLKLKVYSEKKIDLPMLKESVSFYSPFRSTLAVRTAIRMLYHNKGEDHASYGDLINALNDLEDKEIVSTFREIMANGNEKDRILALARIMLIAKPEDYSYLTRRDIHRINEESLKNAEEFLSATELIMQSITLFESIYGPLPKEECDFSGSYNDIVTSSYCGMPVFFIGNTLWLLNSFSHGIKWSLGLLLTSYVMSIHSVFKEFQTIQEVAIYHLLTGEEERLSINEVSRTTLINICRNYIGYNIPANRDWLQASGTNPDRLDCIRSFYADIIDCSQNHFDPNSYDDGIHEITYGDYRDYYVSRIDPWAAISTKPESISSVYLIRKTPYIMFLGVRNNQTVLLRGGKYTLLDRAPDYYEKWLYQYAQEVENTFSKYWSLQEAVASIIKKTIRTQDWNTGLIHGCIVDINTLNHVYINPFDWTITFYYAESTSSRIVYKRLSEKVRKYVDGFIETNRKKEITGQNEQHVAIVPDTISSEDSESIIFNNESIYSPSKYMSAFQRIHNGHVVTLWIDAFLEKHKLPLDIPD